MDLMNQFERTMNAQLLKYVAGTHITCKWCGKILDWRTTVMVTMKVANKPEGTIAPCADCYDKAKDALHAIKDIESIEVIDGRDFQNNTE